jgi:hypothetical protein
MMKFMPTRRSVNMRIMYVFGKPLEQLWYVAVIIEYHTGDKCSRNDTCYSTQSTTPGQDEV